ncbi:MAG TPA: hypothetical protein VI727_01010 [Candidatus Brocadiaceae bacterium]|nr:hypothetical protein [Candidatus Brocadiaceae bacterium]
MLKQDISRLFRKGNEYLGHLLGTFMSGSMVRAAVEQEITEFLCGAHYIREVRGSVMGVAMNMSKRHLRQLSMPISVRSLFLLVFNLDMRLWKW